MLRVTPVYGSKWDDRGPSTLGRCTLIEYGGVSVLFNVGWKGDDDDDDEQQQQQKKPKNKNKNSYPYHDALIISDGCLESMGGLPMYYKQQQQHDIQRRRRMRRRKQRNNKKRRRNDDQDDDDDDDETDDDDDDIGSDDDDENNTSLTDRPKKPVMYATYPTVKMGQMMLYDQHAALCMDGNRPPFTLEELDESTSSLRTIKYSQSIVIASRETGEPALSITAQRAGHAVGGAFFVLQRLRDETIVVVTSTYHVARELHLDSSTLLQYGATPDVLVTQPGGPAMTLFSCLYGGVGSQLPDGTTKEKPLMVQPVVSQARKTLVEAVLGVLRRDGNVLLPVDASSRVLELLLVLSQHWDRHRLAGAYNLIWLGPMVHNTLEFARCQLEWMASPLGQQFDLQRGHPYALKHVNMFVSINELEAFLVDNQNPCCVLASGLSLDHGSARDVFVKWADNPDHAVIFTDSSQASLRRSYHCYNSSGSRNNNDLYSKMTNATKVGDTSALGGGGGGASSISSNNGVVLEGDTMIRGRRRTTTVASVTQGPSAATVVGADETTTTDDVALVEEEAMMVGSSVTKVSEWSTTGQLLRHWIDAKAQGREMADMVEVDTLVRRRIPLAGAELQAFLKKEELTRLEEKKIEEQKAMLREVELAKGRLRLGDNEEEQEVVTHVTTTSTTNAGDKKSGATAGGESTSSSSKRGSSSSSLTTTSMYHRQKKKSRFDSTLFIRFSKPLHMKFEIREEAVGIGQIDSTAKYGIGESVGRSGEVLEDEYGIAVVSDFFQDIVTGVDPSKFGTSQRLGGGGPGGAAGGGAAGGPGGAGESQKKGTGGAGGGAYGYQPSGGGAPSSSGIDGEEDMTKLEESETALEAEDLSEGNGIIRGRYGRPPTKVSTVVRRLEVLAEITYVPLEGRGDARSARQSVRALQPRQVVILGGKKGSSNNTIIKVEGGSDHPSNDGDNEPQVINDNNNNNNLSLLKAYNEVSLLADTAAAGGTVKAFSPSNSESAELSVGHAAYSVRLIDTPYLDEKTKQQHEQALLRQQQRGYLHEKTLGACTVSRFDFVGTGRKVAADSSIVLAPPPPMALLHNNDNSSSSSNNNNSSIKKEEVEDGDKDKDNTATTAIDRKKKETKNHHPPKQSKSILVSDGDVLLTDLRAELTAQGLKAEYRVEGDGTSKLLVNGKIIVTKRATSSSTNNNNRSGNLAIEGPLCEDFYKVRGVVCEQFVTL